MERRPILFLVCLLLSAPSLPGGVAFAEQRSAADEGGISVYLQPLTLEARRYTLTIRAASALTDGGAEIPLDLRLAEVSPRDGQRQRLLAVGRVPAGRYTGLSIAVGKASVRRENAEAALAVPEAPLRVASSFLVPRERTVVLWLGLAEADPAGGSDTFTATFTAAVAPRPMASRTGFVSTPASGSLTIFDKRLRQVSAVVPACRGASGMALTQPAGRLYVACAIDDEVVAIDAASGEVIERARLAPGDGPRELALTPDGRTLVSVNTGSNTVGLFEATPLVHLERIAVGNGPSSVAIAPEGRRAFVFNTISSTISVVDLAARAVAGTVSTEASPLRGQFDARGERLYVLHERSPYATVLDPQQLTLVTRARLRLGVGALRFDARRNLLYVGGRDDQAVDFYDPNALLPVGSLRTGTGVSYMTIDAEDNSLYVVSTDGNRVVVGSLADRRTVTTIDVADEPYWVSVMGER